MCWALMGLAGPTQPRERSHLYKRKSRLGTPSMYYWHTLAFHAILRNHNLNRWNDGLSETIESTWGQYKKS